MISGSLNRFKWTSSTAANFRCNICGDSQKSLSKSRGNFYLSKGEYKFHCFNCGAAYRFSTYLKLHFPVQYSEYKMDLLKGDSGPIFGIETQRVPVVNTKPEPIKSVSILDLPANHPAVVYCRDTRQIPAKGLARIKYTENFGKWVVEELKCPKYANNRLPNDKRILLPLVNSSGVVFGVQGRSLDPNSKARYITIRTNDQDQKLFGMEAVDPSRPIFAVEGPIDSLFLPNAIAFCGGDVLIPKGIDSEQLWVVLDNEPRSKDTVKRMETAIERGLKVCFWPPTVQSKDINDMIVKEGLTVRDILSIVKTNSYSGLRAKIALAAWKKT